MLLSLALIIFCGFSLGAVMKKMKLPPLLGMIITGILLGPFGFKLISPSIIGISAELRQIALIIILIRAGLALNLKDLRKVGRPAVLICFVPALMEVIAVVIFAPMLFGISHLEAAIMGTVLAAVSPAVVIPRMLKLMEDGYGTNQGIPQMIIAGASVDDAFVIVLFASLIGMYQGQGFDTAGLLKVPVSILLGLALGILSGLLLGWVFRKKHVRDTVKILLILGMSFLLVSFESVFGDIVPCSGLLAVMALSGTIYKQTDGLAKRLSRKYEKMWTGAELLLFVLVGAAVDVRYLADSWMTAAALIGIAAVFRIAGVLLCLLRTRLNHREKMFTAISYLPKATVQAAIGGIPLAMGIPAGGAILVTAVAAVLLTAPIGAVGTDLTYRRLLSKDK